MYWKLTENANMNKKQKQDNIKSISCKLCVKLKTSHI